MNTDSMRYRQGYLDVVGEWGGGGVGDGWGRGWRCIWMLWVSGVVGGTGVVSE